MGWLHLGGYKSGSGFSPLSKSVIALTIIFDPSRILLQVGSVPPTMGRSGIFPEVKSVPTTTGQSVSRIFPILFHLWAGSGPQAYSRVFTIFSLKLGIVVVSDNAF